MSEIEVPLEQTQEKIHEVAHEAAHELRGKWISYVALFSALLAAIAAVSAMLAGHHSDEAMITQIRASDQWSYYQAKGIKGAIAEVKGDAALKSRDEYKEDQEKILEKATELEKESSHHLEVHSLLAKSVTLFQIAIAVAAISVLTRRRRYFLVSVGFSAVGLVFFGLGLLH